MNTEELYNKTTEELYDKIVETLSSGNFLTLNGKPINLSELSDYINAQEQEIERLNNIIEEVREYINNGYLSDGEMVNILAQQELLEILDKENK